jgi:hypothetical protein
MFARSALRSYARGSALPPLSVRSFAVNDGPRAVVLVDGCRTPFQTSGSGYKDMQAWQLGRAALHGLAERNPLLDLESVNRIIYGTVIQEV